jgi:thioredoxin-related protein
MIRNRKILMRGLGFMAVFLAGPAAFAIDYQYEYEDDPAPSTIKTIHNFEQQAALIREKRVPLLVEFSSPGCSYCELLEKEILEPMLKSSEYSNRVVIRKLEVSDYNKVVNFTGQTLTSVDWAMSINVDLYPTLVFFNAEGKEISPRLVGITVLDFVPEEIDKRLMQALREW